MKGILLLQTKDALEYFLDNFIGDTHLCENGDILYNGNIVAKFIKKNAHYAKRKIEKVKLD